MDYLPLERIAEDLLRKIKTLKAGEMPASELGQLVSSARNVYERLVILEFQALDKNNNSNKPRTAITIETDSTEEVFQETKKEEPLTVKEEVIEIKTVAPEIIIETPEVSAPKKQSKEKALEETDVAEASESIAEKFENAPIENISKSISLNEKFQFIRVLCHNDSKKFQALLDKLNESSSEGEALSTFSTLIKEPDSEEDQEVFEKFRELIKRRF